MNRTSQSAFALLSLAFSVAPAFAQTNPEAQGFLTEPPAGSLRISKLVGVDVSGMDHERVGRTEEIIIDASGRAQAVVIGVGGFLGIGEKRIAVPFDQIVWNMGQAGSGTKSRSSTTSADAPSGEAAAAAGPQTMPGAQVLNDVLATIDEKRGGAVNEATGSVAAKDQSRGTATVPVAGTGDGPVRAEIRQTKATLQAAPAYRP